MGKIDPSTCLVQDMLSLMTYFCLTD